MAGSRMAPDRTHWVIAQLDDDQLSDLSETGRRTRQELRRQHIWWP
jgi:hypothetical protein